MECRVVASGREGRDQGGSLGAAVGCQVCPFVVGARVGTSPTMPHMKPRPACFGLFHECELAGTLHRALKPFPLAVPEYEHRPFQ